MKKRIPLKLNTELRFKNQDDGITCFYTGEVIGFGGTCVVYDGYYKNNAGQKKTVRIKECYPYKLQIKRMQDNVLVVDANQERSFEEYKERLRNAFKIENDLFAESGLSNSISNTLDIYEYNNTVYVVSSYVEGMTIANYETESLMTAVKIVKSTAASIDKIHKKGYLYLDIKPDNIMVLPETTELIQLFDFDSMIPIHTKGNISDYRISYSMGFAPIEQKCGDLSKIGITTDVFSIGALLFFLIFGRAPTALDCGLDAQYDFSEIQNKNYYNDKLFKEITLFFRNTLQSYFADRYESMQEAIEHLRVIEKYADLSKPFLHSSIIAENEMCLGREQELLKIDEKVKSESSCLFVSGMGGIGKSTIVRKYLIEHKPSLENILYIYCNDSLCNVIGDDEQLFINNCEKSKEESNAEYFIRKINVLKSLELNRGTILVLDNFNGVIDEYFTKIIDVGWKVIAVTRKSMSSTGYPVIVIDEIIDETALFKLFSINIGKQIDDYELEKVKKIIALVNGHTLSVELIAKQIARSYLTIDEALTLVENNGFSNIAKEKIEILKDGQSYYEKISELIQAIYNVSAMNQDKQNVLKILSMFDAPGIQIKELKEIMQFDSYDDVNELIESGWITMSEQKVYLHPIIQATISHLVWSDACRKVAESFMTELFKSIKINGKKEEYPKKSQENNQKIKKYMDKSKVVNRLVQKKASKNGVLGEVMLNRIEECDTTDKQANPSILYHKLRLASAVIKNCSRDDVLSNKRILKDLMFVTIINMPKDQEAFILRYSDLLIHDENSRNPYAIMELYDYAAYICCQREDFESAKQYVQDAYLFAKNESNNHLWGVYYDMLMDYYEAVLNGAYDYQSQDEEQIFQELLRANDKAIHYMSKSKLETSKQLLAKYILGKAVLLIRSFPDEAKEIRELIIKAKSLVEQYSLDYSEVRSIYYMTWAWYYSLCEPDEENVWSYLAQAKIINEHYGMSELDEVDYYYIPAANMMCELDNCEKAIELLSEGIRICEPHNDVAPFMRKKNDLLTYLAEVNNAIQ